MRDDDAEGTRLPIKVDTTSNGEFAPIPLERVNRTANRLALDIATRHARRLGMSRRAFLISACGAAATLLAFNRVNAAAGRHGGHYGVTAEAALEPDLAAAQTGGDEFIFDVQGHYVNPDGDWLQQVAEGERPFGWAPKAQCELALEPGERSYLRCLGPEQFVHDVFMDSDTDMMVLSFVPAPADSQPLTIEEAAATREVVAKMEGNQRLLLHGPVNPMEPASLEDMARLRKEFGVVAFKTYTQWGSDGGGFYLSDDVGRAFIERARSLGVRNIAVHKGLPFGSRDYQYSLCNDIGIVARDYPDMNFLVYHSGFVPGQPEGPYDPERNEGIDSLIRSVLRHDVARQGNVYAELGSTWRYLQRDPESAAHGLGKLLKHLGEDNILWGTDCIWYGSPQDQIQAFRTFRIDDMLQERVGYPQITAQARAKIFGRNAARAYGVDVPARQAGVRGDALARQRRDYREQPHPHFRTYGPRTRREFLNLRARGGG